MLYFAVSTLSSPFTTTLLSAHADVQYTPMLEENFSGCDTTGLLISRPPLSINLGEKNILYDATYRSIMLRPMFYLINTPGLYYKYRRQNLWHIFRLLQYDTGGTQDDILGIYNSDKSSQLVPTVNIHYLCNLFVKNYLSIILFYL